VATGTEHVTSQVLDYVLTHSSPPDPLLAGLRAETARRFPDRVTLQIGAELRLGPATETLRALPAAEPIDLAFIDADKTGYASYWAEIVPRTRSGGIILVDNTFLHGRIFDPDPDPDARAVRDFNEMVIADDRVDLAMLSIGDGVIFAQKK
jgi:caffeoyl-CoA O-methyltransferase